AGFGDLFGKVGDGAVADVDALALGGYGTALAPYPGDLGGRVVGELGGVAGVGGEEELGLVLRGGFENPQRGIGFVRLGQALADLVALGEAEGVGHGPADDEGV